VRVAALIQIDDHILCVRHRAGASTYHLLPGGGVGYRETIENALQREVFEETGLEIKLGPLLFVSDTIDPTGPRHVINLTFAGHVTGGHITSQPEDKRVEAVDLIAPEDLDATDLRPPLARYIREALTAGESYTARYLGRLFTQGETPAHPEDPRECDKSGGCA
jgi:ADP-ribose pyrophosphatase YjhB (NUDIX family)